MKNLIIIIGMLVLGSLIFQMMAGDGPGTLKSSVTQVMRYNISQYAA